MHLPKLQTRKNVVELLPTSPHARCASHALTPKSPSSDLDMHCSTPAILQPPCTHSQKPKQRLGRALPHTGYSTACVHSLRGPCSNPNKLLLTQGALAHAHQLRGVSSRGVCGLWNVLLGCGTPEFLKELQDDQAGIVMLHGHLLKRIQAALALGKFQEDTWKICSLPHLRALLTHTQCLPVAELACSNPEAQHQPLASPVSTRARAYTHTPHPAGSPHAPG